LRRVLNEAGVTRQTPNSIAVEAICRNFPLHLQSLAYESTPSLMRHLRTKPSISLSASYIPWNGPWVGRWCGRDSDLFFVFAKTAVVLICDMLPENTSQSDWVCAPCAALIQAQMLSAMDTTIHKYGTGPEHDKEGILPFTFDLILGDDTVIAPIPLRAPNANRLMAENRLIMLLREFLSDQAPSKHSTREFFGEMYGNLVKAATRRISLYDTTSCFILCDFLDEAVPILSRFYKDIDDPASFIDWSFWFGVLKKMGETNNTMSEVRLYTFIYSLWGSFGKTDARKRDLCMSWLLDEEYFDRQFNHWCPIVRAYYMRLLCWRIARDDGEASETAV